MVTNPTRQFLVHLAENDTVSARAVEAEFGGVACTLRRMGAQPVRLTDDGAHWASEDVCRVMLCTTRADLRDALEGEQRGAA